MKRKPPHPPGTIVRDSVTHGERTPNSLRMKSYSVLIGSNNSRGSFAQRDDTLLQTITARYFPDGFTILAASGNWYNAKEKKFRKEAAREVLICTKHTKVVKKWCNEVGRALGQEELILVETGRAKRIRPKRKTGSDAR